MCDKSSIREPGKPRSEKELRKDALELMKKKHRDMGLIEDVIR
jgi:hypothetical protein